MNRLYSYHIKYDIVGYTNKSNHITVLNGKREIVLKERINAMRLLWSKRSLEMEKEQTDLNCVEQERQQLICTKKMSYNINETIIRRLLFYSDN